MMYHIKKLAYYECYPNLFINEASVPDPSEPSTRASSKQSSSDTLQSISTIMSCEEFDPLAPPFMVKLSQRLAYLYSGMVVFWELIMNIFVLQSFLHVIALIPGFMGALESIS